MSQSSSPSQCHPGPKCCSFTQSHRGKFWQDYLTRGLGSIQTKAFLGTSGQNFCPKRHHIWHRQRSLIMSFVARVTTLGNFLKPLATINLPKSPIFLGNFCKGVKIYHVSREIILWQLLQTFGDFLWSHCYQLPPRVSLARKHDRKLWGKTSRQESM